MDVIDRSDKRFESYWRELWDRDVLQYPRYLPLELEAARAYAAGPAFEDRSAVVVLGGEPIAGLVLTVERSATGQLVLSAYGRPIYWLCNADRPRAEVAAAAKRLGKYFQSVREGSGASGFTYRDFCVTGALAPFTERLIQLPTSVPRTSFTQILDLAKPTEQLLAEASSANRESFRKSARLQKVQVIEGTDATIEDIEEFRRLHTAFRGREVRTREAWHRLLDVVRARQGFLVYGYADSRVASVAYFALSERMCCSRINAVDLDVAARSWTLALVWRAMDHARDCGCRYFEAGERVFPGSWPTPTPKYLSMSDNKAGFGGMLRAHLDIVSA